jgi:membrane-bound lytic murein transglycosylase A
VRPSRAPARRASVRHAAGFALAALLLHACASHAPRVVATAPPAPPYAARPPQAAPIPAPLAPPAPRPAQTLPFSQLAGWDQEDHAAALDMFRERCGVSRDPAWHEACLRARDLGPQDEVIAKAFWETNFRLQRVGDEGLLTGYFAPEYPARAAREYPYTAALRPRPDDLPSADVGAGNGGAHAAATPYADRAAIEDRRAERPLAWMKPEDLFFLQIQGSGVLDLPDGRRLRAVYAANNGLPFVGIAAPMKARGLLAPDNTSGEAIRAWLAGHRGPDADEIMRLDPRYIFFTVQPYDGAEPAGAAGVALAPGRALAVDPSKHDYGVLYWIDGEAPALAGAFPRYRRLAMALDTGNAIKGEVRADLYLGTGDVAGAEAGRVKHRLRLYRLVPQMDPALAAVQAPRPPSP